MLISPSPSLLLDFLTPFRLICFLPLHHKSSQNSLNSQMPNQVACFQRAHSTVLDMPGSIFLLKICFIFDFCAGWYTFLVSYWPISILKHRELPSVSWPQWTGSSNSLVGCCSVMQLCLTLCDPMDCSTPDFTVLHRLLEFAQTHVYLVSDVIQTISSSVISLSQHQGFSQ